LRVALVDADTHTTGLGNLLEADGKPGVLDFLRGEADSAAVMHPTDVPGLTLVPAGTHADQTEGAFLRPELAQLVNEIKADRDFVIIDAAPILRTDDTALLVPYADTVVVVVRPFFSRSRLVRQALEMLYQRQAKQITFVLNRARKDDISGYYARNGLGKVSSNGKGTSAEA
jgi:Mrp family chromosome partitioning ATPase